MKGRREGLWRRRALQGEGEVGGVLHLHGAALRVLAQWAGREELGGRKGQVESKGKRRGRQEKGSDRVALFMDGGGMVGWKEDPLGAGQAGRPCGQNRRRTWGVIHI